MNREMWNLYKEHERGRICIELFSTEGENPLQRMVDIFKYSEKWSGEKANEKNIDDWIFLFWANLYKTGLISESKKLNRESFFRFMEEYEIWDVYQMDGNEIVFYEDSKSLIIPKDKYRAKATLIPIISVFMYYIFDEFKPLLLPRRFDIIQRNCDALGIKIPIIPKTKDYREYMMYYYDLCATWNEFQKENDLSNAELCACIYDFASMLYDNTIHTNLPKPTNVWLTGASGKEDFLFLDSLGKKSSDKEKTIWACNERTRRGDIIIIYCTSPRSYIHSIWRSDTGGFFNPFDYYHCRTTVCDGIRTPQISFNELKKDKFMSQVPIVKKNLQGINGIELSAKEYFELLRIIESKGGHASDYPQLFECIDMNFGEIKLERDVEEKILIPMLERLGYSEKDWTRQLAQKAGRKEKIIPDFVFFPRGEKHFENAPMVIEAKLDMAPVQELQKAYYQALSYARILHSSIMGICDKERLILYRVDKDGTADRRNPIFEDHWLSIYANPDVRAKLNCLIGREKIVHL
ncbi:hypothetical protein PGJ_00008210 [Porphyromonas gingivalis AJW4]|uniref:type I restriction enzyme HsdR N-terminal domain-containing protein n=1 Tax=Porphyromonas gingivalis TaxID=837 RepID=UPI0006AA1733|nr:type I restriction enzyme HsdR N-terminal domain-containing protein [Porphyromonas gingivalis]ALA93436.1 hypothetical protein PGJ_00008210 [Porphyromonas gingivalis AJW4]